MKKIIKYCVFAFVMLTYVATASKLSYAEEKQKVTVINNKGTKVDTYEVSKTQVNEEKELKPVVPSNLNENTNSKLFKSASTYKVIGQDTRTLISNTHAYPYTAIARLTMTFNGISGVYHGTGFVIGSNVLATAGHCLVQVDSNGNKHGLKSLKVEFGYNQYSGAYRTENGWSQCIYYGDYTKPNVATDYGFVILNNNVENYVGGFGIQCSVSLNQQVTVTGYPGDKDSSCRKMYTGTGTVGAVFGDYIHHNVDTYNGQSGAPVYAMGTDGPYATAIHYGGDTERNLARRLDSDLIQWLFDHNYL